MWDFQIGYETMNGTKVAKSEEWGAAAPAPTSAAGAGTVARTGAEKMVGFEL
jgi:hypothetical protein